MKRKLRLKPYVLPSIYLILVVSLFMAITANYSSTPNKEIDDMTYVSDTIFDNTTPVVSNEETKVEKPFNNDKVKINKSFYDYKMDKEKQKTSIIYYEDTYLQNTGTSYIEEAVFDVTAILNGTVIKVDENELLGKTIEIRHDNNLIGIYQSVNEVNVKEGDYVTKGQVIAKSGTSKIYSNKHNLHFELIHSGKLVNPEEYYDKLVKDL